MKKRINSNLKYCIQKIYYIGRKIGLYRLFGGIYKYILFRKKLNWIENNILIEKHKTIYFPIPKVASTSIKVYLSEILNITKYKGKEVTHNNFPYIKVSKVNKRYKDYFKFTFVRNPYSRLVSCYKDRILKEDITIGVYVKGVHANFLSLGHFYAGMSFYNFVKEIDKIDDKYADMHFRSQYGILSDSNGDLIVDFVGKLENINIDFDKIIEKVGFINKNTLTHLRKTNNKNYREYYNEEIKNIVRKRYQKDIELFNYKF